MARPSWSAWAWISRPVGNRPPARREPDVDVSSSKLDETLDLRITITRTEVEVDAALARPGFGDRDEQQPGKLVEGRRDLELLRHVIDDDQPKASPPRPAEDSGIKGVDDRWS
jgi:hypothetical protein